MSDRTEGMELLVEEGPIRAVYAEGQGTDLVISFSSIGRHSRDPAQVEFIGSAIGTNRRHALFVTDENRSWANAPEFVTALTRALEILRARCEIERIAAIGYSMGGFCALAAQTFIPINVIIAIAPQYSIMPRHVSDLRWRKFARRIERPFAFPVAPLLRGKNRPRVILLHAMKDDLVQASAFAEGPRIFNFLFPEQEHAGLAQYLKSTGQLAPLIDAAIEGDRRAVVRAVRRAGGDFRARVLAGEETAQIHSAP